MKPQKSQWSLWSEIGFSVELTQDGSPTLRLLREKDLPGEDQRPPESMHHSGGAYSESVYIYGQILEEGMKAFSKQKESIRVLSLGLGLGYNELLTAAWAIKEECHESFQLFSFETVPGLVDVFVELCVQNKLSDEISSVQSLMLSFLEKDLGVSRKDLLSCLDNARKQGRWKIFGDFLVNPPPESCHVFLYDAFSQKTTENLWTEEFLEKIFTTVAEKDALFGTYACRASLKKALARTGFQVVVRPGFLGKRNSTQARKGSFVKSDQIY